MPSEGTLVYEIVYGNAADASAENVELTVPVPANTQFVEASGGGTFDSGEVSWSLGSLSAHSGSPTGTLTLRVLWPEPLNSSPYVAGGGTCSGSCDDGEYLSFNLGVLGPGATVGVGFNENSLGLYADGSLLPLEVELIESGLLKESASQTVILLTDSPLEIAID